MEDLRKITVRSFASEIPAQFARITLSKLGIDSRVKVHSSPLSSSRFKLVVDTKDASLAVEILDQAEQYEKLFLRCGSDNKKHRGIFGIISKLLKSPN